MFGSMTHDLHWHAAAGGRAVPSDSGRLEAAAPLKIDRIDHTKVDVTVVDPVTRLPISRPTLILAIDVSTRMAMGFNQSLTTVALCLTHAVINKSGLADLGRHCSEVAVTRDIENVSCRQRRGIPCAHL